MSNEELEEKVELLLSVNDDLRQRYNKLLALYADLKRTLIDADADWERKLGLTE
jgi:hypothetical protein